MRLALTIVVSLAVPVVAYGGPGTWTTSSPGGRAERLAVDAGDPNIVYAASSDFLGVSKSTDGGETWRSINAGLPRRAFDFAPAVAALVADSRIAGVVYCAIDPTVAADVAGVYVTSDGGESWTRVLEAPIRVLQSDPATGRIFGLASDGRLFVSTGGAWSLLHDFQLPSGGFIFPTIAMAISPAGTLLVAAGTGRLERSTNGGVTWSNVSVDTTSTYPTIAFGNNDAFAIASGPSSSGFTRLIASNDGGVSWSTRTIPPVFAAGALRPLFASDGVLFVGSEEGLFRSTDGGLSWTDGRLGRTHVTAFAAATGTSARLYVGTRHAGVFRTTDGGTTWAQTRRGLRGNSIAHIVVEPSNASVVYAATEGGVYKSIDATQTWSRLLPRPVDGVVLNPASTNVLYAKHLGVLSKSSDGGVTWQVVFDAGSVSHIAIDPLTPNRVYLIAYQSGAQLLFRSDDAGGTFQPVSNEDHPITSQLVVSHLNPNLLYTVHFGNLPAVHRSIDGGVTWLASQPPEVRGTGDFVLDPHVETTAYVVGERFIHPSIPADRRGVYRTVDSGATWTLLSTPGIEVTYGLAIDSSDPLVWYAGGQGGVVRSIDGGQTWADVGTWPRVNGSLRHLTITERGVYAVSSFDVAEYHDAPPRDLAAEVVASRVTLRWNAPIDVAGLTGYHIEVGTNAALSNVARVPTDSATTSFSAAGVPEGTYYIRVRAMRGRLPSAASNEIVVVTTAATPGVPRNLTATVTGDAVNLTWAAPSTGGEVASYIIDAGRASGSSDITSLNTGSTATSFSVSGVPEGRYYVRIRAANPAGTGAASNEVTFAVGSCVPPQAPTNLQASVNGTVVTLTWSAPSGGGTVTAYQIEAGSAPGQANLAVVTGPSTTTTFSANAPPGTYFVRIRAVNGCGISAATNEVNVPVP